LPKGFSTTIRQWRPRDAVLVQPLGQRPEERRRDREVEGAHNVAVHDPGQIRPAVGAGRVDADIGQPVEKPRDRARVAVPFRHELGQRGADHLAVARVVISLRAAPITRAPGGIWPAVKRR
jgi:hypothetical protein